MQQEFSQQDCCLSDSVKHCAAQMKKICFKSTNLRLLISNKNDMNINF